MAQNGRVFQINISPGGVPKLPVAGGVIGELGIESDGHNYSGHGGPDKALCLYSLERILEFQREGHPIYPGSTGENLTISGLNWDELKPGDCLRIGDEILIRITSYTAPCGKVKESFARGDFSPMDQKVNAGRARLYASVVTGGTILPAATVEVISET
ncbi:MAG: MOSC domain-containing protein [Spirochaetales bacterium]|nr:MAG: MOSC domain-containing protein [Spirochaetales bacterium]